MGNFYVCFTSRNYNHGCFLPAGVISCAGYPLFLSHILKLTFLQLRVRILSNGVFVLSCLKSVYFIRPFTLMCVQIHHNVALPPRVEHHITHVIILFLANLAKTLECYHALKQKLICFAPMRIKSMTALLHV